MRDLRLTRTAQPPACGTIVAVPHAGGLHHHYERRAGVIVALGERTRLTGLRP